MVFLWFLTITISHLIENHLTVGNAVMAKQKKVDTSSSIASPDLSFIGSKDEHAETRNIASRQRVRSELDDEVARFLNAGGKIDSIAANVMGDPPRKPESSYGSRPI